jgi:hypothetical protein
VSAVNIILQVVPGIDDDTGGDDDDDDDTGGDDDDDTGGEDDDDPNPDPNPDPDPGDPDFGADLEDDVGAGSVLNSSLFPIRKCCEPDTSYIT